VISCTYDSANFQRIFVLNVNDSAEQCSAVSMTRQFVRGIIAQQCQLQCGVEFSYVNDMSAEFCSVVSLATQSFVQMF
jgi:hypothetical protein